MESCNLGGIECHVSCPRLSNSGEADIRASLLKSDHLAMEVDAILLASMHLFTQFSHHRIGDPSTPLGSTPQNIQSAFVGLMSCFDVLNWFLDSSSQEFDQIFFNPEGRALPVAVPLMQETLLLLLTEHSAPSLNNGVMVPSSSPLDVLRALRRPRTTIPGTPGARATPVDRGLQALMFALKWCAANDS